MGLYSFLLRRGACFLDAEQAHNLSIFLLSKGIIPPGKKIDSAKLRVKLATLNFQNPVGLAAGFDKNAQASRALLNLGFGFLEVGTVTPLPQTGNPKPRIFRLDSDRAIINRLGFNNQGHDAVLNRLQQTVKYNDLIGINIGANRDSKDFAADYEKGLIKLWNFASYFTINISSPNTPGLRKLQLKNNLHDLLARIIAVRDNIFAKTNINRPIFLKIAPDLTEFNIEEICEVITNFSIDGLVIANTTISREGVNNKTLKNETGGLSGKPLFTKSTIVLAKFRVYLGRGFPIIGVGGIDSIDTAWIKFEAGADLVQVYSGFVYKGPYLANKINLGLIKRMNDEKINSITEITARKAISWSKCTLTGFLD